MICAEAKLKLEPCVSGTLSPEDRIALEEHLAICEGCRLELELTRAVMGAPSFESADEPPAASAPATPVSPAPETPAHESSAPETPAPAPEAPPSMPVQGEARAATPLFDEISFADLGSGAPAATSAPTTPPGAASDPGETDPFANFTRKPEEPAGQASATWDFEPAEVPRDSSPPEGSLSFANEALKRKREVDEKRKTTLVRLALWGGGIGCGLVLLGVSVWIALAFRQEKAPEFGPDGETPAVAPHQETAPPPDSTATQNAPDRSATPVPVATQPTTPAPAQPTTSTPAQPTSDSGAPPQAAPTILNATPGVAPSPGPRPPDATKSGANAAKGKSKPGAKAPTKSTATSGSSGDDELFPWKPVDDVPTAPSGGGRTTRIQRLPDADTPKPVQPAPVPPPQPAPTNPPEVTQPSQGTTESGGAPAPSAGTTVPANPSPAGEPAPPPPQDPASMRPIDRLHLATETAAKNADLDGLRKLKSSWKSMVGSTAGPDRTRAKLEYADCLWSIQEISGRNSDRRDALTAYRDYVLYAPAGGTNSRTVGRMRYLEDILTDK